MKVFVSSLYIIFSLILLIYMVIPGTVSVQNFSDLPNSSVSTLPGDVWQVPNIKAYFSDHYRDFATEFYYEDYKNKNKIPFDPIKLNYPPENAYTYIKDQTQSTYLEEYVYPLRDSIFLNGMEPFTENGEPRYAGATKFDFDNQEHLTKNILRYYPSSLYVRIVVWFGIIVSILLLWITGKRVILND